MSLLRVENLDITFRQARHHVHAVRGVSFSVNKGETLALVGESGSGKSVTSLSIVRVLPENTGVYSPESRIEFDGLSILEASA